MAGFGLGWGLWGAGAVDDPSAANGVRVALVVVGAVLITRAIMGLRRAASGSGTSMVGTRSYWVVTAAEFLAIAAGGAALGATDNARYVAAWVAAVVGVHFLAFGRRFWRGFLVVGGVILAGAAASLGLGLSGAADGTAIAVAAFVAAGTLDLTAGLAIEAAGRARTAG